MPVIARTYMMFPRTFPRIHQFSLYYFVVQSCLVMQAAVGADGEADSY